MTNINACLVHERPECVSDLVANLRFLDPASLILLYDGSPDRQLLDARVGAGVDGVIVHPDPKPMRWGRLHDFALDALRLALTLPEFSTLTVIDSDQLASRPDYSGCLGKLADGLGCLVSPDGGYQPPLTRSAVARAAWEEKPLWQPLLDEFSGGSEIFPQWTFWPATVFTRGAAADVLRLAELPTVAEILRKTRLWATEEILLPTLVALAGHRIEVTPFSMDYVRYRVRYTQRDVQRALQRSDVFWIHPVARSYHDPNRRFVRERYAGYSAGCAPPNPDTDAATHPVSVAQGLLLTLPLLDRMESIPGVLTRSEGDLLLAAARQVLSVPPHRIRVTGDGCARARFLLDAVISNSGVDADPGAEPADLVVAGAAGADGFSGSLESFTEAEAGLADSGLLVWRRSRRLPPEADTAQVLVNLGIVSSIGETGGLAVLRLVRRLALPQLGPVLDRSAPIEGWLSRDEAALMALMVGTTSGLPPAAVVEVGSYCGRGTVVLAALARLVGRRVLAVDPFDGLVGEVGALHRGMPTLDRFRSAITAADVADVVETVEGTTDALRGLRRPVAVLVVDGLHDYASVAADFAAFADDIVEGGVAAFHDCADYYPGVQAMARELKSTPGWRQIGQVGTLVVFQRVAARTTPALVRPRPVPPVAAPAPRSDRSDPRVSCIMPTYDRPDFVELAIGYFLRQDYPHKELVIVDDGQESVAHLVPTDDRIRYLRTSGRTSIGDKRNLACEAADGDLIAHWDDDDWYSATRLTRQVRTLMSSDDDVVGANNLLYWSPATSEVWRYAYPPAARPWLHDPTLCYRKTLWAAQPFPATNHGLDCGWLWNGRRKRMRALHAEPLYVGIIHPTNTSRKATRDGRWVPASMDQLSGVVGADLDHYRVGVPQ